MGLEDWLHAAPPADIYVLGYVSPDLSTPDFAMLQVGLTISVPP